MAGVINVVLVDPDDRFLLEAIAILAGHPHLKVVGIAHSAREAIALAEAVKPDVVMADHFLPDMYGVTLTLQLRKVSHPPKVVIVSSNDHPVYRDVAGCARVDGYLTRAEFATKAPALLESLVGS